MKNVFLAALAVGLSCLVSLPAQATIINYTSELSPAAGSTAEGGAGIVFAFDDAFNSLSWTISFLNLSDGGATAAHFHSVSSTGPIEINLATGDNTDTPSVPATITNSGIDLVSGSFQGFGTLSTAQITDLLAGNMYVNIHTEIFPSGELSGRILEAQAVVPVPAAVWLFGSGLLGLVGMARRKKA